MIAAPSPCSARAPISAASLQASPDEQRRGGEDDDAGEEHAPPPERGRQHARRAGGSRRRSSAYALMTHWRFSGENPRSVWMDGSATFTIAMSSTTMNCTAQSSASASHFRRADAITGSPFVWSDRACQTTATHFRFTSTIFQNESFALQSPSDGQELRPVLPDGARALAGRASAGRCWSCASCSRARSATPTWPTACRGSARTSSPARLRDLEEGGVVAEAQAPAAGRLDRLRADRVRRRPRGGRSTRWPAGARARSARRRPDDELDPEWGVNALPALFNADEARGLTETYVLRSATTSSRCASTTAA